MKVPEKVFILAGNFAQYRHYRYHLLAQFSQEGLSCNTNDIIYIHSSQTLRGFRDIFGYKIGTWKERSDFGEIELQLQLINSYENFIEVDDY